MLLVTCMMMGCEAETRFKTHVMVIIPDPMLVQSVLECINRVGIDHVLWQGISWNHNLMWEEWLVYCLLGHWNVQFHWMSSQFVWLGYWCEEQTVVNGCHSTRHTLNRVMSWLCDDLTMTTHTRSFYGSSEFCPGLPGWAGTRNVKPRR